MAVGDEYVFPGCLTPVLTQLFYQKPQTTFLTCFCGGERREYAGKKLSKLKAFADYEMNVAKMMNYVFDRGENIVGKGENAGYHHLLLFLQCFQKTLSSRMLKVGILW